jgi:hypothetical protein
MINLAIGIAGLLATALLLRAVALRFMEKERRTRATAAQEIDLHIRTDSPQVELPFIQGEVIRIGKVATR